MNFITTYNNKNVNLLAYVNGQLLLVSSLRAGAGLCRSDNLQNLFFRVGYNLWFFVVFFHPVSLHWFVVDCRSRSI